MWIVSGIGLAIGIGFYPGALMATGMVLISLILLRSLEGSFARMKNLRRLWIRGMDHPGLLGNISAVLGEMQVHVIKVDISEPEYMETFKGDVVILEFHLRLPSQMKGDDLLKRVALQEGVLEAGWKGER